MPQEDLEAYVVLGVEEDLPRQCQVTFQFEDEQDRNGSQAGKASEQGELGSKADQGSDVQEKEADLPLSNDVGGEE